MKTTTMRRTVGIGAATLVAILVTLVMAFTAFAMNPAKMHGVDTNTINSGDNTVKVFAFEGGTSGETIYVDVFNPDGLKIANKVEYKLGSNETAGALYIEGLTPEEAAKGYLVTAYGSKDASASALKTVTVYPVYAQVGSAATLIGVRTLASDEARTFSPEEDIYANGASYVLQRDQQGNPIYTEVNKVLTFSYEAYDPGTSAVGTITYVDDKGNTVLTAQYPGITSSTPRTIKIPSGIVGSDGVTDYRVVYYGSDVVLSNPGHLNATIQVKKVASPQDISQSYYYATVNFVDKATRNVIATDKVSVLGEYNYTVPEYVYQQKANAIDPTQVDYLQYELADKTKQVISFKPANGTDVTYEVEYELKDTSKSQKVTFNLVDTSKKPTETGRLVRVDTADASMTNPTVTPPATIQSYDGKKTLNIVGNMSLYTYTFGKGGNPVINVYYAPAGTPAPADVYNVTVNYVNLANNALLQSKTITLDPKQTPNTFETDNQRIDFDSSFTLNGEQYVLIAGQNNPIWHNYYSGNVTYTIYYRNVNDNLHVDTYVTHITVVYNDTVVDDGEGEGTAATPLPANETLNSITTPNGGLVTNNVGVDSETIREDGTPLAQNPNDQFSIQKDWPLVVGGLGIAALAALIIALLLRKRNESDDAK